MVTIIVNDATTNSQVTIDTKELQEGRTITIGPSCVTVTQSKRKSESIKMAEQPAIAAKKPRHHYPVLRNYKLYGEMRSMTNIALAEYALDLQWQLREALEGPSSFNSLTDEGWTEVKTQAKSELVNNVKVEKRMDEVARRRVKHPKRQQVAFQMRREIKQEAAAQVKAEPSDYEFSPFDVSPSPQSIDWSFYGEMPSKDRKFKSPDWA